MSLGPNPWDQETLAIIALGVLIFVLPVQILTLPHITESNLHKLHEDPFVFFMSGYAAHLSESDCLTRHELGLKVIEYLDVLCRLG